MAIITISRGTNSGGQSLAECVSKRLGYRCVSRELLVQAAKDYGVEEEMLSKALEGKPGILERMQVKGSITLHMLGRHSLMKSKMTMLSIMETRVTCCSGAFHRS